MPNALLKDEVNRLFIDIANYAQSKGLLTFDSYDFDIIYDHKEQVFSIFTHLENAEDEFIKTSSSDLYELLSSHAKSLMGQDYLIKDIEGSHQLTDVFKDVYGLARTGLEPNDLGELFSISYLFKTKEFSVCVELEEHRLLNIPHDDDRWNYIDCFDGMDDTLESDIINTSVLEALNQQPKALKNLILDAQTRLAHLV